MSTRILPEGSEAIAEDETILWQGKPLVVGLVRQLFHIRAVMGYFAVLALYNVAVSHGAGFRASDALLAISWIALGALGVAGVVYAMAWILVATTHYTITDKRVIMQVGVALPIALTLPLRKVSSAEVKLYADGSGDIPLSLGDQKLAYLLVWPHARPWRFKQPEPMLRAIPDAHAAATILSRALLKVSPQGAVTTIEPVRAHEPQGEPGIAAA